MPRMAGPCMFVASDARLPVDAIHECWRTALRARRRHVQPTSEAAQLHLSGRLLAQC